METHCPASHPTLPPAPARWLAVRRADLAAAAALLMLGTAQAAPTYSATMLALPQGATGSRGFGVSDGVVVGQVTAADGTPRAVIWADPATPQMLAAGALESTALAISGGVVAGVRSMAADPSAQDALRWGSAVAAPDVLGAAGGVSARATSGRYTAGSLGGGAFVHDAFSATMMSFDQPGAVAHGVNSEGIAVGQNAERLPAVFNGTMAGFIDVLGERGNAEGAAYGVLGDLVVGSFDDPASGAQRAFLMQLGTSAGTQLFNGAAFALNAQGEIVGADFEAGRAMLYVGGVAYDLNQLVGADALAGFTLTQARAIDAQGRIVAFGVDAAGRERSFLLARSDGEPPPPPPPPPNPVPEPGSAALLLAALATLRLMRR